MKIVNGGVTAAKGFLANGISCGIKRSGRPDLSLIVSQFPSLAAGVFTRNSIKAAPLIVTQQHLRQHKARAVICNSGNANCFTGTMGLLYAKRTADIVARSLNIEPAEVIVASTGIIGKPLPFNKISRAIPLLIKNLGRAGGHRAALGIMTTDVISKEIALRFKLGGKLVTIGACAKGSGMIQPNMATMLAFLTTDVVISARMLKTALQKVVQESFNCITVDGCMSTNDMVTIMANGQAHNRTITNRGKDFKTFSEALKFVCLYLAKKIVLDGEGATKFLKITVRGARNESEAKRAAFAIANSNLVKTAAYGSNPNWGRVAAAVGSLELPITEQDLRIKFSPFQKTEIQITVNLNLGRAGANVYTCDLSPEYVAINGKYN